MSQLEIFGERTTGQEIRTQNVTACVALANIIKSSLGPEGLDKMLVDQIGDVTVTNDGATILDKLEVEHPAAKVLVELAQLQEEEVGDGTTSVVIVASELLKKANELVKRNIHPTSLISGYRVAMKEACEYIKTKLSIPVDSLGKEALLNIAKTSMSSKNISANDDYFADLCVRAVLRVKHTNRRGVDKYPISNINLLRSTGKSARESLYVEGYALNCTVASQAMPKSITKAKIAFLDFNLTKTKLPLGVSIKIDNPEELLKVHDREAEILKERVMMIINSGANVVLTTKGIDDLAIGFLVNHGVMGVRRCNKSDLRKIAKATGGKVLLNMANLDGEESFDSSLLGEAETVAQETIADNELIIVRGTKQTSSASIVLRGPNELTLDEIARSVHDALSAVKRVLESKTVVPGGGAVEVALAMYLESFARRLGSREQLAIAEFAQALLIIPKTLSVNSAKDASELVAKLCTVHQASQKNPEKEHYARYGLDLSEEAREDPNSVGIRDNVEAGVIEPSMSKIKSIQFATEAAMSILRIDDMIKLEKKPEPEPRHQDIDR